jgi:hypothetical protein
MSAWAVCSGSRHGSEAEEHGDMLRRVVQLAGIAKGDVLSQNCVSARVFG